MLHFDVVFLARSQADPMNIEGMSPLFGLLLAECGWRSTREHIAGNPFPFTKHLRGYLTDEQSALRFTASAGGR